MGINDNVTNLDGSGTIGEGVDFKVSAGDLEECIDVGNGVRVELTVVEGGRRVDINVGVAVNGQWVAEDDEAGFVRASLGSLGCSNGIGKGVDVDVGVANLDGVG